MKLKLKNKRANVRRSRKQVSVIEVIYKGLKIVRTRIYKNYKQKKKKLNRIYGNYSEKYKRTFIHKKINLGRYYVTKKWDQVSYDYFQHCQILWFESKQDFFNEKKKLKKFIVKHLNVNSILIIICLSIIFIFPLGVLIYLIIRIYFFMIKYIVLIANILVLDIIPRKFPFRLIRYIYIIIRELFILIFKCFFFFYIFHLFSLITDDRIRTWNRWCEEFTDDSKVRYKKIKIWLGFRMWHARALWRRRYLVIWKLRYCICVLLTLNVFYNIFNLTSKMIIEIKFYLWVVELKKRRKFDRPLAKKIAKCCRRINLYYWYYMVKYWLKLYWIACKEGLHRLMSKFKIISRIYNNQVLRVKHHEICKKT